MSKNETCPEIKLNETLASASAAIRSSALDSPRQRGPNTANNLRLPDTNLIFSLQRGETSTLWSPQRSLISSILCGIHICTLVGSYHYPSRCDAVEINAPMRHLTWSAGAVAHIKSTGLSSQPSSTTTWQEPDSPIEVSSSLLVKCTAVMDGCGRLDGSLTLHVHSPLLKLNTKLTS